MRAAGLRGVFGVSGVVVGWRRWFWAGLWGHSAVVAAVGPEMCGASGHGYGSAGGSETAGYVVEVVGHWRATWWCGAVGSNRAACDAVVVGWYVEWRSSGK